MQDSFHGGLKDLEVERLVVSPGSAGQVREDGVRVTEKLWTLTPAGLEAAAAPPSGRGMTRREPEDRGGSGGAVPVRVSFFLESTTSLSG
ncbi:hypothetical protein ABT404_49005 [Streptomyces hyaluromycini]|uniref:Uncharacterized protein n=1 Tax=Streptomyces hyaluromycini TaxID=1377993 RepID=A0ABV1XE79_9ACTN